MTDKIDTSAPALIERGVCERCAKAKESDDFETYRTQMKYLIGKMFQEMEAGPIKLRRQDED